MHGFVLALAGLAAFAGPATPAETFPYLLQWKRLVGEALSLAVEPADTVVFVAEADGRLEALHREDGTRLWQHRTGGPVRHPPVLDAGRLVLADSWGRVASLRRDDGRLEWEVRRVGWGEAVAAAAEGVVYVSGSDGWLYSYGAADGRPRWRVRVGLQVASRPCLEGERLYAGTRDGRILALDARTGAHLGSASTGTVLTAGPLRVGRVILTAGADGRLRAYRSGSLEPEWERRLGTGLMPDPAVAGDTVMATAANGYVYALRASDGEEAWKHRLSARPTSGPGRGPAGEIVVGSEDGRLVGLEPGSGAVRWEVQLLEKAGVRAFGGGERLYVGAADGYLYAFAPVTGAGGEAGVLWEDWWEVHSFGRQSGYRHRVARALRVDGEPAVHLREEWVSWSSGFSRSVSQVWVDGRWQPLAFAERRVEGDQVVETEGRWQGAVLRLVQRLGKQASTDTAVVGRDLLLPAVVFPALHSQGRLAPGRADSVRVLDYATLQPGWLHLQCGAPEETPFGPALSVRLRSAEPLLPGLETLAWIDPQGREVRERVPMLEFGQERVSRGQALAWVPPQAAPELRLDYPVAEADSVDELVLELPAGLDHPDLLLVQEERQELLTAPDGGTRLRILRTAYSGEGSAVLPITEPEVQAYLGASLYVQADDERVRQIAAHVRAGERDAWEVARRLRDWVYDHMIPQDTNVRFKSTAEVLEDMEGTCSEYAVLYLSLCRAAGLPGRACVGFLVGPEGELVLHIWSQVYVGVWVDVDPTLPGEGFTVRHIKTGQGQLDAADLPRLNVPLLRFLVQADTLRVAEYRTGQRVFLGAAEQVFQEAVQAQRQMDDARSLDLHYRVSSMPWNQRSAESHVEIARHHLHRDELDAAELACRRILDLAPQGEGADQSLFYLARIAEARHRPEEAAALLARLGTQHPDSDLADDALGRLAELRQQSAGCAAAVPLLERLREEYAGSGWASVAQSMLERCRRESSER
ncbi:MAG: PQQ-binding-like beta-propeller repeat protein [Candidatus Latescibacterota bacterium]